MGLFDKQTSGKKRTGLFGVENPYDTTSIEKQISNADTRIKDAGYKKEDSDQRNWFEKSTNLPQGQNWFFDTLELLGRPGGAIKNAIDKTGMKGTEDLGTSLWRGFSGQEKVHGSEIAKNLGVENKVGKFALGLGLDIGLDPLTYVPGGVLLKGAKGAASLATAPVRYGYKALEAASPAVRGFRETRVVPAVESAKDALGYMFKRDYRIEDTLNGGKSAALKDLSQATDNSRQFMQGDNLLKLGNTARAAGGIEAGKDVGRIIEAPLRQFEDVKGYEFPDGLKRTENKSDLVDAMNVNRDLLKSTGKDIRANSTDFNRSITATSEKLQKTDNQIRRLYFSKENEALRQLTKRKNKPLNIDELAQSKAFSKVSVSPAFNYLLKHREELKNDLTLLRNEADNIKTGGIAKIAAITDDNAALKEASRNPVMIQKQLERPARELSQDPKIQSAARQLVAQNKEIVDYARQNGIAIPELEGHMYHILSQEERAFKKTQGAKGNLTGGNQPNKSILNNRQYTGSVEDINENVAAAARRKFDLNATSRRKFEDNAFLAQSVGQKRMIDYIHAVSMRKQVLDNKDFAVPFKKGMNIPKNSEVIDSNNYKFLKESGDELDDLVPTENIGGQYLVTKAAKQVLDRYQKINTDEGTKAFLKVYDTMLSFWKRGALFSLGYHARNHAGAMFNNYVGGMNPIDLAKYTKDGFEEVTKAVRGKESELFNEYRRQGLSSSALSKVEFAKFGEEPEKAIERTVKNLSKDTKGQITQRLNPKNAFQTSQEIGNYFDQANRFALYKWSRDKGMTAEQAAAKVREVQFDYSKTTPFESNVVSRVVPFYRWMRNNIPFQIKQFINDPRKYEYVNKARENAQEVVGLNDENIPDYMKENFNIPVYGDGGKGKMLGLNLPLGDLAKLSRPGKTLVDSTSALIKTPAELALNYNTFLKKPIEKFAGQEKQYQIPFTNKGFGIDAKTAYALEQATGQIGRGLSGFLQKPESVDQDTLNRLPSLGISSLAKDFDAEKYAYYKKLDELKKMQDLMLYIQQQTGAKPRSLNEIKKAGR